MKQMYMLVGPSGSGKSTIREQIIASLPGALVFSLDDCRLSFYCENNRVARECAKNPVADNYREAFNYSVHNGKEFDSWVAADWKCALKKSTTLIVDNTNLTKKSRARWINDARHRHHDFKITIFQVMVPLSILVERQSSRGDKNVSEMIVTQQFYRQEEVLTGFECEELRIIDGTEPFEFCI